MKIKVLPLFILALICISLLSYPEELPIPTYNNSLIISIEHNVSDSTEVDYIINNFNFGLYAWLSFSYTTITVDLGWHHNLGSAFEGIQNTKNEINAMIEAARDKNVRLHIVLTSGLARGLSVYSEAKEEDIRNCKWYSNNKLASDSQISQSTAMNSIIFGTFSRYARKLRANLEAKAQAFLSFLKQKMDENPDVFIAISGWGKSIEDDFCDYSPFIILEFIDWIRQTGLYDSAIGKYAGEGYSQGGTKYQGAAGLTSFNQDFGTSFGTWNLKYFNWSLNDDYDSNPEDTSNNDPYRIPYSSYSHGNMMPTSGANYIANGFDPPRTIKPGHKFWDLWNLFRETVVLYFVKDMAKWASEAGIPANMWYSNQTPADYLFNTKPDLPESSVDSLLQEFIMVYNLSPHVINFWRWWDDNKENRFKGMNKEQALAEFINLVRDKARKTDLNFVFDPPQVTGFSGRYIGAAKTSSRRTRETGHMRLTIDQNIWSGYPWEWKDWGDFAFFEVYRGDSANIPGDTAYLLGTTENYTFEDRTATPGQNYTYKIKAVNTKGKAGPFSKKLRLPAFILTLTAGPGGTTDPPPGIYTYSSGTNVLLSSLPAQGFIFSNLSGDLDSTSNPESLLMNTDKDVKANFLELIVRPPINITGNKYENRSLVQMEYVIVLTWESNPLNQDIIQYNIYQLDGGTYRLLAELDSNTFSYTRRRVNDNIPYTFAITALNQDLKESVPSLVVFELKMKKQ